MYDMYDPQAALYTLLFCVGFAIGAELRTGFLNPSFS